MATTQRRRKKSFRAKAFSKEERNAYKQTVLDLLQAGIESLQNSEAWKKHLKAQSVFHRYSFRNCLLIQRQCPEATHVAGYKAWKVLGRQVGKEAKGKGLRILCPIPFKTKELDDDGNAKQGVRFGVTTVFDISQTKGDPLPIRGELKDVEGEDGDGVPLLANLKAFAMYKGIPVETSTEKKALYYGREHKIVLGKFDTSAMDAMALAHELGHAFFRHGGADCKLSSPVKELEAQSVAFIVCDYYGHETGAYTFEYIAGWKGPSASKTLLESGSRIQKAAREIIDYIDEANDLNGKSKEGEKKKAA